MLVVTGKGGPKNDFDSYRFDDFESSRGVLKREVPLWLSGGALRQLIVSFQDAQNSVDYYNFRYTAHFCKTKLQVVEDIRDKEYLEKLPKKRSKKIAQASGGNQF